MKHSELMWEIERVLSTIEPRAPIELPRDNHDLDAPPGGFSLDASTRLFGDDDRLLLAQPLRKR